MTVTAAGFPQTQETSAFADAVADLLAKHANGAALRTAWESPGCRIPGLWKRLEEIGIFELAADGVESLPTLLPAVIETGRSALPEPILGSLAVGTSRIALPPEVTASSIFGIAAGPGQNVPDAAIADAFVLGDGGVQLAGSMEVSALTSLDPAARLGKVSGDAETSPGLVFEVVTLLAAGQLQGLAEGLLSQAVDYAKLREQFGKPIGSFQAIKHQLADVYVAVAFSRPIIDEAARSLAAGDPQAASRVSHAKIAATDAAAAAARTALQVHGGIGYTYEHDLHMWTKKVWTLSKAWGDRKWHAERMASALLDRG